MRENYSVIFTNQHIFCVLHILKHHTKAEGNNFDLNQFFASKLKPYGRKVEIFIKRPVGCYYLTSPRVEPQSMRSIFAARHIKVLIFFCLFVG